MDDDIPLPLPAAALKQAQCRRSWLQAVNDRFKRMGITGRANRERPESTLLSRLARNPGTAASGQLLPNDDPAMTGPNVP
jgi:hypothetical protein